MNIFGVLTMAGGLALFLYGMNVMGDSLAKLSGGKLEQILEKLTSKRIMAVLLGMAVTAVIQSSSATTVMVVGFVNSGIMQLSQAVGIIMGANIGTTVTSWMLSLTGISGAGWINLLKPSSFSPVLAVIGIIMTMTCKDNSKKKDIGNILLGFAILMLAQLHRWLTMRSLRVCLHCFLIRYSDFLQVQCLQQLYSHHLRRLVYCRHYV